VGADGPMVSHRGSLVGAQLSPARSSSTCPRPRFMTNPCRTSSVPPQVGGEYGQGRARGITSRLAGVMDQQYRTAPFRCIAARATVFRGSGERPVVIVQAATLRTSWPPKPACRRRVLRDRSTFQTASRARVSIRLSPRRRALRQYYGDPTNTETRPRRDQPPPYLRRQDGSGAWHQWLFDRLHGRALRDDGSVIDGFTRRAM